MVMKRDYVERKNDGGPCPAPACGEYMLRTSKPSGASGAVPSDMIRGPYGQAVYQNAECDRARQEMTLWAYRSGN